MASKVKQAKVQKPKCNDWENFGYQVVEVHPSDLDFIAGPFSITDGSRTKEIRQLIGEQHGKQATE